MKDMQQIDRSLVVIFDIEGYSKKNPETQAELVKSFIGILNERLGCLQPTRPDVFSTGDGAIVSLGRNCVLNKRNTKLFMDFVIDFALNISKKGLLIRTAVSYADKDWAIPIDNSAGIQGDYIQAGDTINIAERILGFCEPQEIIISQSTYDFLRSLALDDSYPLFRNDPVLTKHGVELRTFTYDPPKGYTKFLYSPHSPSHTFKKYFYFPPVRSQVIKYFMDNGLDFELHKVISHCFTSVRDLNNNMRFISQSGVLDVLTALTYDPKDTIYVLSRNDRTGGFWTQPRRNVYIGHLKKYASRYGGYINQKRVMVYDDSSYECLPVDDIYHSLLSLHNANTFFSFPSTRLVKYPALNELLFGFTLSVRHKFAIISTPSPEAMGPDEPSLDHIGAMLRAYEEYDVEHGPMKAIIVADRKYVEQLIQEMDRLIEDDQTILLR